MTTHVRAPLRTLVPALALVLLVALVAIAAAPTAYATESMDSSTTVAVSPATSNVKCGEDVVVDFRINDVANLYGADIRVKFDPKVVEVVDANGDAVGVQIVPGDMPDVGGGKGLIQVNMVDVDTGQISYAAVLLNPAEPQTGSGIIASATFRGVKDGESAIEFISVMLSDKSAKPIASDQVSGKIGVVCHGPAPTKAPPPKPTKPKPPGPTDVPTAVPPGPVTPEPEPPIGSCIHVVKPGDTLYSIANWYGVTVNDIMQANGITDPNTIYVGQELTIPGCVPKPPPGPSPVPPPGPSPVPPVPPVPSPCQHTVAPGDTLFSISLSYGTTVPALMAANGIADPNLIYVGQVLTIPGCGGPHPPKPPPGSCFSYTVVPGDTLSSIAMQHGDTVYGLAQRNGIANPNLIFVGQVLQVCPGSPGPGPGPGPGPKPCVCKTTHVVQPGDTVYGLTVRYGSSARKITYCNNLASPHLIYVGQSLCIP